MHKCDIDTTITTTTILAPMCQCRSKWVRCHHKRNIITLKASGPWFNSLCRNRNLQSRDRFRFRHRLRVKVKYKTKDRNQSLGRSWAP
jgi:hypothetical protein